MGEVTLSSSFADFTKKEAKYAEQIKGRMAQPHPQPVSGPTQQHQQLLKEQHFLSLKCSQMVLSWSTFC